MFFCFQVLEILQAKKALLCCPVIMAAKDCNLILESIMILGTCEPEPWVLCGRLVLAWCAGWFELTCMQYQGSLISWFRIACGIPLVIKGVPGMSWTAYGCYCFISGFASTCPVPTRCQSLSCCRINCELRFT